jgi:hypothetical protein
VYGSCAKPSIASGSSVNANWASAVRENNASASMPVLGTGSVTLGAVLGAGSSLAVLDGTLASTLAGSSLFGCGVDAAVSGATEASTASGSAAEGSALEELEPAPPACGRPPSVSCVWVLLDEESAV